MVLTDSELELVAPDSASVTVAGNRARLPGALAASFALSCLFWLARTLERWWNLHVARCLLRPRLLLLLFAPCQRQPGALHTNDNIRLMKRKSTTHRNFSRIRLDSQPRRDCGTAAMGWNSSLTRDRESESNSTGYDSTRGGQVRIASLCHDCVTLALL